MPRTAVLTRNRQAFFRDADGYESVEQHGSDAIAYTLDLKGWLGGETISTVTWSGSGVTVGSASNTTTTVTAKLSALTVGDGAYATVDLTIVTSGSQTRKRTLRVYRKDSV